jgi:hypothetical protein
MVKDEVQKHRHIRIKFWENMLLFFSDSWFGFIIPQKFWAKKKKLLKLLREGRKRIEKELDIVKIMKSLRDIKLLMKNSLMTPDIKFQVAHCEKNFIDIELDGEDSSNSDDFDTDK